MSDELGAPHNICNDLFQYHGEKLLGKAWGCSDKVENVYLISIAKEEEHRRIFEENFKRKLSGQGIRAVTSYKDLPRNQENKQEDIIKAMTGNDCDSVLPTKLVRKRTEAATKG